MARSTMVPCGRCGYENVPQHRFCGICGFPLPSTPASEVSTREVNATAPPDITEFMTPVSQVGTGFRRGDRETVGRIEPASPPATATSSQSSLDREPVTSVETRNTVSGPSFLGLASESNPDREGASYLLEDEQSSSHRGRLLIVLLFLIAMGAAVWHWRQQVGDLGSRLSSRQQTDSQATNGAPVSASPSEVAPAAQSTQPIEQPKTGVGDTPAGPQQNGEAPNGSTLPNSDNSQASSPANSPTNSSASPTGAGAPTTASPDAKEPSTNPPSNDSSASAAPASSTSEDADDAEKAMEQQTAKAVAPKRPSRQVSHSSAASPISGDPMEAEGEKYLYGNGVPQDCNRAQRSLLAAAGRADAKAQSVLGTMYATGHCAPRDLPLAYKWFAKALHEDPNNDRLSQDLKVLWNQMSPDERQLALRNQ